MVARGIIKEKIAPVCQHLESQNCLHGPRFLSQPEDFYDQESIAGTFIRKGAKS